jgi:hypothetical protein
VRKILLTCGHAVDFQTYLGAAETCTYKLAQVFGIMSNVEISGTVVHIRKVSRKLVFFDIVQNVADTTRQTVVLKFWNGPELVNRANRGPDKIHVGDVVKVIGCREEGGDVAATDFSVTDRWSDSHSTETFCPIPPPVMCGDRKEMVRNVSEQMCKFFLNTGRCAAADSCRFRHSQDADSIKRDRLDFVGAKLEARRQRHEPGLEYLTDTVASSARRAEVFGRWILERFGGLDHLRSGVILDVGGGRGDLGFELAVKLSLPCWTVDPRPQKFRRWQLKMLRGQGSSCRYPPVHKQEFFSRDFLTQCGLELDQVRLVVGEYRYSVNIRGRNRNRIR